MNVREIWRFPPPSYFPNTRAINVKCTIEKWDRSMRLLQERSPWSSWCVIVIVLFWICTYKFDLFIFLQSNKNVPNTLRVIVEDVVEGNFTLDYKTLNNFKLENMSISAAAVTVPEVRVNTCILYQYINIFHCLCLW